MTKKVLINDGKKMPKDIKKTWLTALRSGKFLQTTETLREVSSDGTQSYCCLGVLSKCVTGREPRLRDSTIGKDLRRRVGLTRITADRLAELNDDFGWSFKQIATWVEKNL